MIPELDKIPSLSTESKRLLAELSGSKYFDVLKELVESEFVNLSFSQFMTKGLPNEEKEYWCGYANSSVTLLLRLKEINQEVFRDN